MYRAALKSTLVYLFGLFFLYSSNSFHRQVKAKGSTNNSSFKDLGSIDKSKFNSQDNIAVENKINQYEKYFLEDFSSDNSNLINLLTFNFEEVEVNNLDIESEIQYEEGGKFYAKGDVVLNFKNAILKADLVIFDRETRDFIAEGNITFYKGKHYFEASKLIFNLENNNGFIENVYGILNIKNINKDFELKSKNNKNIDNSINKSEVTDLEYVNTSAFGLINTFEEKKRFNITDLTFNISDITKWRFKTDRLNIKDSVISSDNIFFTNDALNEPQFFLQAKRFSAETVNDKVKILSRNTWIILDDKFKLPLGRRRIFDDDPLSKWAFGSDYKDKDGIYISRGFGDIELFKKYKLNLRPSLLVQRAIKGKTKSFRKKDTSILSATVEKDNKFSDLFGLDMNLKGEIFNWDLDIKSSLNSLDLDKLSESSRFKLTLQKTFNLNEKSVNENEKSSDNENLIINDYSIFDNNEFVFKADSVTSQDKSSELEEFGNLLDLQFTSSFREKIYKGFSGDQEIYFGNAFTISNTKYWRNNDKTKELALLYSVGEFKARAKNVNILKNHFRNVFVANFNYKFPLWQKNSIDENINSDYKYSSKVIKQGLNWNTDIRSGIFLYSNGKNQKAITFNSGPELTLGSFKSKFFDYSKINVKGTYVLKGGESPFAFDSIDGATRVSFNLEQQLVGPLVFTYQTYINLDNGNDHGKFSKPNYALDIKRRAYSLGAFYNVKDKSLGVRFNIFNFNYGGIGERF